MPRRCRVRARTRCGSCPHSPPRGSCTPRLISSTATPSNVSRRSAAIIGLCTATRRADTTTLRIIGQKYVDGSAKAVNPEGRPVGGHVGVIEGELRRVVLRAAPREQARRARVVQVRVVQDDQPRILEQVRATCSRGTRRCRSDRRSDRREPAGAARRNRGPTAPACAALRERHLGSRRDEHIHRVRGENRRQRVDGISRNTAPDRWERSEPGKPHDGILRRWRARRSSAVRRNSVLVRPKPDHADTRSRLKPGATRILPDRGGSERGARGACGTRHYAGPAPRGVRARPYANPAARHSAEAGLCGRCGMVVNCVAPR